MNRRKSLAGWVAFCALLALVLTLVLLTIRKAPPRKQLSTSPSPTLPADREPDSVSTVPPQVLPEQSPTVEASRRTSGHNFPRIEAALSRETSRLSSTTDADGTVHIDLNGGFQSVSMARRKPDGSLEVVCFNQFEGVRDFLLNPADPPPPQQMSEASPPLSAER